MFAQDSAEPKDLLPLLSLLRADESLCRGTSLWTEFITWLKDVALKSPKWSPIKLRQSIRDQLDGYMSMKSGKRVVKLLPTKSLFFGLAL